MSDEYLTAAKPGEGIFRDRGSRFLGFCFPVENEDDISGYLKEIAALHHSSRHVCYAWRLGREGALERSSDAGEPSGTAGKPILNQIRSAGLTNTLVIVVRYFGGTLLGTGGLIHAYREAAALAISGAGSETRIFMSRIEFTIDYSLHSKVFPTLSEFGAKPTGQEYLNEKIRFTALVPESRADSLLEKLAEMQASA